MSNTTNNAQSTSEPANTSPIQERGGNTPTHAVYHVRDNANRGKGFWTRLGSAWPHADGQGFNIQMDSVPLDGRLTLRVITDKKE